MRTLSQFGHPLSAMPIAPTLAQLKALDVSEHQPLEVIQLADGRFFQYVPTSVLAGDDIFVVAPDNLAGVAQAGRYVLAPGFVTNIRLPITNATADAAVLATLPANSAFQLIRGYWEVGVAFTGGTASAIGLSSSQSPYNTKGDLLGGAGGDLAATLVVGSYIPGTIGADVAAGVILTGGATVRNDRIVSNYTTGSGAGHLVGIMLANPGA